jgi:phenylpyruvate tautomerase PptA (4-oxalocrotonate tautomerase family)
MPFVQITLLEGKSKKTVSDISDSVHRALIDEFNIPEKDKFQTIREVKPGNLIFPSDYLKIPHTDDIVFIHITAKEGRTIEMKKKLYSKIASLISDRASINTDDVFIVLSENKEENWSFGRGVAQLAK